MKVVAINGSPRKGGNTEIILKVVFQELEKQGIETELVQLGGKPVRGCMACGQCFKNKDKQCIIKDDMINECIAKMEEADGIILGSPVYFTDVTTEMKALIDRAGFVSRANGDLFKHKAGAAVMAVRRGGATHAFDTMNHFLHYMQMFLVGGTYWNMVYGREIGEVENDKEGMLNMKVIGENMAWLLKKIKD
ncbi:multimeric flavodoxin WrbA [Anaerosolibacter carboniphilus]|uniref:Multimeric flavodoxin WrbA n=1 Tax=Anaerosolibacter carboniphilus TaxID=1417629 RepID=A0A841KPL2_9FIRM|nr:flavodoxin family protein [Anaerosolibacter carboniphilus]MBB6215261.1 multimeric flavodoxin WrbA [Anaerosolibacter carboniphilus]